MRLRTFRIVFLGVLFGLFCLCMTDVHSQTTSQLTAILTGSVTDPAGATISGAEVSAAPLGAAGGTIRAGTGADGRFVLKLAVGKYRVSISHSSFEEVQQEFTLVGDETREWSVRMALARLAASVVVTAEAEPVPATSTTAPVDIFTRPEIDQRGEIWLAPMLGGAPGISISRLGPEGGITSIFLDGGNSNFTKVLVDGTPVNDPGDAVDFSNLTLDNVEKIEVVHGASSALFGSDAMTGVVQIFTRQGTTREPQFTLLGEGGMFSTWRGLAQLSGLVGRFDYSAAFSRYNSNGEGVNDAFRDAVLSGNFGYRFTETDTLRLIMRSTTSDAGIPGQTLLEPRDTDQHDGLRDISANLAWDFTTGDHWHHHLAGTESYTHELFANPGSEFCFPPPSFICDFPFTTRNEFNRAGFVGQSSYLFPKGAATLGYQAEEENAFLNGVHARRDNQAGYLDFRWQPGQRWTATLGGRAEANASFGTRVVPRAGLAYAARFGHDFWGATRLRASYGWGIKEPTLVQSFSNDPCFTGNPSLRPERSHTFDAGVEQFLASDRLRLFVDYFHNRFYDIVSFASTRGFCGTFFNTDLARAYGAHAGLEARVARWLHVSGNYTYDNSRVLRAPNAFDPTEIPGNRLLKRPLHSASLIVNAAVRRMNWNLAGYYVGRRTDSDFLGLGLTSNPSYVRWDLATSYNVNRRLALLARVENLFNRHYQDAIGYPALRLNYRAGVKYTWGAE